MIRGLSRPIVGLLGLAGFVACGSGDDRTTETSAIEEETSITTVVASGDSPPSSSVEQGSSGTTVTTGASTTPAPPNSSISPNTIGGADSSVDVSKWDGGVEAALVFARTINFQLEDHMDAALAAPGDLGGRLGPGPFERATEEFVHDMNDILQSLPAPPEVQAIIDKFIADLVPLDAISHARPISRDAQAWEAALKQAASGAHDYYDAMGFAAQGYAEPPPFIDP